MAQVQATQLRRGNTILHNGELHQVVDYQHITPGNWRGMTSFEKVISTDF